jgi:hypothetical protein
MIEVTLQIDLSRYLTGKYLDLHKSGVYEYYCIERARSVVGLSS